MSEIMGGSGEERTDGTDREDGFNRATVTLHDVVLSTHENCIEDATLQG